MSALPPLDILPVSPIPENLLGYFDQMPEHLDHDTRVMIERLAEQMFSQGYMSGHRRGWQSATTQAIRDSRRQIMPATLVDGQAAEVVRSRKGRVSDSEDTGSR